MLRFALAALLVSAAACAPALPSTEPLGTGPLAERDSDLPRRAARPSHRPSVALAATPATAASAPGRDAAPPREASQADAGSDAAPMPDAAPAAPIQGVAWPGEYVGEDVSEIRSSAMPNRTDRDPKARTRIEQTQPGRIVVIIVDSGTGNPMCTLDADVATAAPNTAILSPRQKCFGQEGAIDGTLRSGRAELRGDRLTVDMDVDLEISLDEEMATGDLKYHFEGTRH